jgi:hypothetical protein
MVCAARQGSVSAEKRQARRMMYFRVRIRIETLINLAESLTLQMARKIGNASTRGFLELYVIQITLKRDKQN